MSIELEAANEIAPLINETGHARLARLSITTGVQGFNLSSYLTKAKDGHFVTLIPKGCDVFFFFNNSDAGTPDPAQTTAGHAGVCWEIDDGGVLSCRLVGEYTWLRVKGSASGTLMVRISSLAMGQGAENL